MARLGFIGLGNIGQPMAERLIGRGEVQVFDVVPGACAAFRDRATIADSPAVLGRNCDLVGICVRDAADADAVVRGDNGSGGLVAIHSTIEPAHVVALAEAAERVGVVLIDAAVTGGPHGAREGRLTCLVGGTDAAVEQAAPMLTAYSARIIHAGSTGSGMALKAANNLVTYAQLLAGLEGYRLTEAAGIDPDLIVEVMTDNGNLTPSMKAYIDVRRSGPRQMGHEAFQETQKQLAKLAAKDLGVACALADEVGLTLPLTRQVSEMFEDSVTKVHGNV